MATQPQPAGKTMSYSMLRRRRKEKLSDAVAQLGALKGVFGIMVTTENWNVITSTFDHNLTFYFKRQMRFVEEIGAASIRDADPKNDLHFVRVQSQTYEILLSVAKDHRVLVIFSSSCRDPLKGAIQNIRQMKRDKMELKRAGKATRAAMDPCLPHTKIVGGKEKVIITEKISGKLVDQGEDINNL